MLYNSYNLTIQNADFTFQRLAQFREHAQAEGAFQYTPDLADKATRIVEQAETSFERFDDFTHHGVIGHHVWSLKDPAIHAALRFNLGQSAKMDLDQLRADTAQLTGMIKNIYAFRGRVMGTLKMYEGWASELAGRGQLKTGEAHTLDAIEKDVVPALERLLPRIDHVIRSFEDEERERYRRIAELGNMIFIMRGGFTGRYARFNPNLPDKAGGGGAPPPADGQPPAGAAAQSDDEAAEPVMAEPGQEAAQHDAPEHESATQQTEELDRGRRDERRHRKSDKEGN